MKRLHALLALLALVQIASPTPATAAPLASVVMVPGCGSGNSPVPLTIPMTNPGRGPGNGKENSPCCGKLCHVNDRKRSSGHCCGPEDESDDA